MIYAYGYKLRYKSFIKLFFLRIFCTHKTAKFHACTGANRIGNGDNIEVGVSFACPKCHRSWAGGIKACAPSYKSRTALESSSIPGDEETFNNGEGW